MNLKILISLIILYEIVALVFIHRLWCKRCKAGITERIALTVVLLIPFIGFIFYVFLKLSPEPHGDNPPERIYPM